MADTELITFTHLEKVLDDYARDAREIYGKNLALGGKSASHSLIDTATARVETKQGGYEVSLNLNYYWKFVEGGAKGQLASPPGAVYPAHFPPTSALARWISVKPIIPRPDASGHIPSPKELAYLIGRKIALEGIEPHPALATTIEELNTMYRDKIAQALAKDCEGYMGAITSEMPELKTRM